MSINWIVAGLIVAALSGLIFWWRNRPQKMPDVWPLATRRVFTRQEQEAYALLRSAFPDQAVLVKLPLSRFLQLTDTRNMKYWFGLLTPLYVTFAVCRPDGKVLAAVDFDSASQRGSRSGYTLKRRAFDACKLQYLRFDYESMPTAKAIRTSVLGERAGELNAAPPLVAAVAQAPVVAGVATAAEAATFALPSAAKPADGLVTASKDNEIVRAQLEQLMKARRQVVNGKEAEGWTPDSILGRDSFLRADSRIDAPVAVDIALH